MAKLANATFPFERIGIAETPEQGRLTINVDERITANIARRERQEATGVDLACMRDEDESLAVIDARLAGDDG
jgi:hypothetical protein